VDGIFGDQDSQGRCDRSMCRCRNDDHCVGGQTCSCDGGKSCC
jgi:hypothetical protein